MALKQLNINTTFDMKNINPIISDPKTKAEIQHDSISSEDCYAVIHAITKRFFHVKNKLGDLNEFQIEKGDILVIDGNIEFSRCNLRSLRAIEIHVPIGYIGYTDGNIEELGWRIFRNKWTSEETQSIAKWIIECIKKAKLSSTETWSEVNECKTIRAYPAEYFPLKKEEALRIKTNLILKELNINTTFEMKNINPIISYPNINAEIQNDSISSENCYAAIHAITKRIFHVKNKDGDIDKFQIEKGDILLLKGNIEISRANLKSKKSN